MDLTNDILNPW